MSFGNLNAKTITPEQARQNALQSISLHNTVKKLNSISSNATSLRLAQTVKDSNANPIFYIFSRGENAGYVIAAGDDRMSSVLGYSDRGTFTSVDKLPEPVRYLLGTYEASYNQLSADEGAPTPEGEEKERKEIKPLLEAWWGQDAPFNNDCPIIGGLHAPVGCVGLANAMVMYFHKYPEKGVGSVSYTASGATISYNFEEHTFDYDIMLPYYTNTIDEEETEESQKAVADLCFAAAAGLESKFTSTGTAASLSYSTFSNRFQYPTDGLGLLSRDYFTIEEWDDIVYEELSNGRPVVYGGKNGNLGHAFVIDGYKDGLFNINWGWFGDSDGYFKLTSLRPGQGGTGSNSDNNYSVQQEIVRGVRTPEMPAASPLFIASELTFNQADETFTLASLSSKSGYKEFILGLAAYDSVANQTVYLEDISSNVNSITKATNFSFTVDFTLLKNGRYRLRPVIKLASSEIESSNFTDWYPVYCNLKKNRFCDVEIEDGKIKTSQLGSDVNYSIVFDNLQLLTPIIVGENTGFTLDAKNNGNTFLATVKKKVYRRGTDVDVSGSDTGREIVGLEPGASATIAMALNTTVRTPGEYDIQIVDSDDDQICYSARIPITVLSTTNAKIINGVRYIVTSEEDMTAMAIKGGTITAEITIQPSVNFDGKDYTVDMIGVLFGNTSSTIRKVNLPETLKKIAPSAFLNCSNLSEINLPENLEYLGGNAFGGCKSLTSIELPKGITEILTNTFNGAGLTSINLHEGITFIGKNAFSMCKLPSIVLPSTIDSLGEYAFNGMNFKEVVCKAVTPPSLFSSTFSKSCFTTATLIVPSASRDAYKNAEYWENFSKVGGLTAEKYIKVDDLWYEITPEFNAILVSPPDGSSYDLQRATIPAAASYDGVDYKVVEIAEGAFRNVKSLTAVSGGSNVKKVGSHAFENSSVASGVLFAGLEEIGDYAYFNTNLGTLARFPGNLKRIGEYAFAGNKRLTFYKAFNEENWLELPECLESIGDRAFEGCETLDKIQLNSDIDFGNDVFAGCSMLESICLGNTSISLPLAKSLADYLENAHFYIDRKDREYFKGAINRPDQLYDILSVESIEWDNKPKVKGITHATVTFDSTLGNPAVSNFIMKDQWFRDIGSVIVESTDHYATDGTITITIAPAIIGAGHIQINFVQSGLGTNFDIEVVEAADLIQEINLSATTLSLTPNQTATLEATYSPQQVYDSTLQWISSNINVATVDEQGNVTAVGVGTATITCKALLGIASTKCSVTVEQPLQPGKALDDGTDVITVADVNAIASHIMGNDVENFNATNADANQDGSITISDITTTVKMILNAKNQPEESDGVPVKVRAATEDLPVVISFDNINIEPSGSANVIARLIADDDYSSIQADINCPQGLEISDIQLAAGLTTHSLAWKKINDNCYRLIIYSVINDILPSNEDEIATIMFRASNTQFGELNIKYGWAATPAAIKRSVTSTGGSVSVTTSINNVIADNEIVNVYNTSGVLIIQQVSVSELNKQLAPGFYIVVGNEGSYKLHIK
ncbi:MAG: leucine-rich repeat protein [Duncaniella sp.]|nr:leucine-rich repeat protein [Duncaniella sp.]